MRNHVQLYINDQLVDLFDFEDINIVDTIQDVRDISKVFVPFSRQFTVPASKNNNIIFKHYYNSDIVDGFDARFKISAVLKINGVVYKKGKVVLNGCTLKNNQPSNYKLVFYASTIDLKTLLGDDMLSELSTNAYLNQYNIDYDVNNVELAFEKGWSLVGGVMDYNFAIDSSTPRDLIFPFISSNNYYFYDSDDEGVSPVEGDTESRNLSTTTSAYISATSIKKGLKYEIKSIGTTDFTSLGASANTIGIVFTAIKNGDGTGQVYVSYGVNYRDLRGGIRLPIILDAIADKYGFTFNGDFLSTKEFENLYLYLQKDKGLYEQKNSIDFLMSEATYNPGGDGDQRPLLSENFGELYYKVIIRVTPTDSSDSYKIKVKNNVNENTIFSSSGNGTNSFIVNLKTSESTQAYDLKVYLSEMESSSVTVQYTSVYYVYDSDIRDYRPEETSIYSETKSLDVVYSIGDNMPKIKTIDFLSGIFNMFNLTAYSEDGETINLETLDNYYTKGETLETVLESPFDATFSEIFGAGVSEETYSVNISKYVNTETIDVNRNKLYSEIAFKFEEASTFAVINSNEITNDGVDFGNEIMDDINEDDDLRNILAFDGGKYEVAPKFEKIQYERMTDQSNSANVTDIGWGWLVDKDQKSVLPKPILFYGIYTDISASTPSSIAFDKYSSYSSPQAYYRPSNSLSNASIHQQSLNFGSEFDEFHNEIGSNEVSLFNIYWKNYIKSVYSDKSRIISVKAHLPASLINSIKLNTVLVLNNKKYRINKLNANITTGLTDLELITYREIEVYYSLTIDTDTITVDTDLITIDTI